MRLDYSEKKGPRESTERKPVQKNRPRKESSGLFALLSVAVLLLIFGAGVGTGWFLYKGMHKVPAAAVVVQPEKKDESAPVPPAQATPAPPETPLTFYKTLPAGGKGVIGSGLNPKKPEQVPAKERRTPAAATVPATVPVTPAPPAAPSASTAPQEEQEATARFVVQIASYREKQEADRAQLRLTGKGLAAYVLESKLRDNGVWYRIRVGRHLTRTEAEEIAAKAGKGAVVLPE